ncbi:NACHT domain-containing protein [Actinomadura syzygii]|uniref:NACHT domain-containing protein n=1 Tax=Actinomadura syzygii TaxID=1427538 RepID=A0A5D0TRC6_9ACTN|nr:NACHT domain-containing protein [Actinomadura syzygii]TYC08881.1 NACHT domain-containing protein [Actinomadura syzygii]
MAGSTGRLRRLLVLVVGQAALLASVVVLLVLWRTKDLATAANTGQILGVVLALPALSVGLFGWWWRGRTTEVAPAELAESVAVALARLVGDQWEDEAALRALDDPDPMPVRWRLTTDPGLVDVAAQADAAGWEATGEDIERLVTQFRTLERRRLVVLGAPGAGKTTLAVQMVRELIRTRGTGEPVPVLLSATSWTKRPGEGFWDWLADHLARTYPALLAGQYGRDAYRDLVAGSSHLVLPVIDGLDEMPTDAQAQLVDTLNATLGTGGLILTCRTTDYLLLADRTDTVLSSAAVIDPEPLTPTAAADYLARTLRRAPGPDWRHVLDHLSAQGTVPESPLAQVCSTPLGLWLVRVVYRPPASEAPAPSPSVLIDPVVHPTAEKLHDHLFEQLVPALVRARRPADGPHELFRPRRSYRADDVTRWLAWIARHLSEPRLDDGQPRTRDLAWWKLGDRILPKRALQLLAASAAVAVSSIAGFLAVGLTFGMEAGVAAGVLNAIVCILSGVWDISDWTHGELPEYGRSPVREGRSRGRVSFDFLQGAGDTLIAMTAYGCIFSVFFTIVLAVPFGVAFGLAFGLETGIWAALLGGSVFGFLLPFLLTPVFFLSLLAERVGFDARTASAVGAARVSRKVLVRSVILGFIIAGIEGFAVVGIFTGTAGGLAFGASLGCTLGCGTALSSSGARIWLTFRLAGADLGRKGVLPWRLMSFLEDAHRLGLLRAVGPIYQFRHAEFQDHLADRPDL